MPITKSAIKEQRKNKRNRIVNKSFLSKLKTYVAKVRKSTDLAKAKEHLQLAIPIIDKAASKKIIHKNAANMYKSRLQKFVNKLGAQVNK